MLSRVSVEPVALGPVARRSERSRALILRCAAREFRAHGYYASTLRKIADAARMEAGSIYYHFSSKEELLDEVLDLGLRHIYDAVGKVRRRVRVAETPFREAFRLMIGTHLDYLLHESDYTSANIRSYPLLPPERKAAHRKLRRAYAEMWEEFLLEAQEQGALRSDFRIVPLRQFVLGALNWTVEWVNPERYQVYDLSERVAKLLLDGMSTNRFAPIVQTPLDTDMVLLAPGDSKGSRTRTHVLAAAARVLYGRGYKAATMRAIAQEAGMEAGSIYYHFPSKDGILDEVLDLGLRSLIAGVTEAVDDESRFPDHRSRIAAAVRTHMVHLFQLSEFASANVRVYGQLPREVRARHRPLRYEYAHLWDRYLREAQRAGEIRSDIKVAPLRQLMLGALNWTVEWFDPHKSDRDHYYSLPDLNAVLQTLLLDGLQSDR